MRAIEIETKRLRIRPRSMKEIKEEYELEQDPEMKQVYLELFELMQGLPGREEWGSDWKISLISGQEIGGVCFKGEPDELGAVEIGYGIDEMYQNNGYATEMVSGIVEWALNQHGVKVVKAETLPDNIISQKVLLKNGFIRVGEGQEGPIFERCRL